MRRNIGSLSAVIALATPGVARAGMPSITLTDVARLRVESLSFFLLVFLLSAGVVQLLWNWLRADFPRLPRLSYPKAVGVVTLWGLLFVVVLTMISGARELLTPGAWEKVGLTYKLAKPKEGQPAQPPTDTVRRVSGSKRADLKRSTRAPEAKTINQFAA